MLPPFGRNFSPSKERVFDLLRKTRFFRSPSKDKVYLLFSRENFLRFESMVADLMDCREIISLVKKLSSFRIRTDESEGKHPHGYKGSLDCLSNKAVIFSDISGRCSAVQDLLDDRSFYEGKFYLIQYLMYLLMSNLYCRCRMTFN